MCVGLSEKSTANRDNGINRASRPAIIVTLLTVGRLLLAVTRVFACRDHDGARHLHFIYLRVNPFVHGCKAGVTTRSGGIPSYIIIDVRTRLRRFRKYDRLFSGAVYGVAECCIRNARTIAPMCIFGGTRPNCFRLAFRFGSCGQRVIPDGAIGDNR